LQWEEIRENCIELAPDRTKNHRAHRLPLPAAAAEILRTRKNDGAFIFPSRKPGQPFNGFTKAKRNLDKAVGIDHYTLHDLRRTLSSNMARLGIPIHVTEKILNHQSGSFGGVAGIYNRHTHFREMEMALQKYNDFLKGAAVRTTGLRFSLKVPGRHCQTKLA
jgi:integrase